MDSDSSAEKDTQLSPTLRQKTSVEEEIQPSSTLEQSMPADKNIQLSSTPEPDPMVVKFLSVEATRDALNDMLRGRDSFLLSASKFIEHRTIEIIAVEETIFEPPSQPFEVYKKIFSRLPHVKDKCAIPAAQKLADTVNAAAAEYGLPSRSLQEIWPDEFGPGGERSVPRDMNLDRYRGHSKFINFIEAFVQLTASCKESKHAQYWTIFFQGILKHREARWAILLKRALTYLELAFEITIAGAIDAKTRVAEYKAYMELFVALHAVLNTMPKDSYLKPSEDIVTATEALQAMIDECSEGRTEWSQYVS